MLMPESQERLLKMKPDLLASLVKRLPEIASKLVALKAAFPTADISQMVSRQPALALTDDFTQIEEAGDKLTRMLPGIEVDRSGLAFISVSIAFNILLFTLQLLMSQLSSKHITFIEQHRKSCKPFKLLVSCGAP